MYVLTYFTGAIETSIFTATPRMEVDKHFSPKTLFDLLPSELCHVGPCSGSPSQKKNREAHYEVVASRAEVAWGTT